MSIIPVPPRIIRISVIAVAFVGASVTRVSAIDIDRYGNAHVTPQDMQDASNAQSRADAANWQRRLQENAARNSGAVNERVLSESEKQEAYRKALRQSIYDESVAANARYEASMRRWAAEREAKEAARKADIEGALQVELGFIKKFANEQRRIAAVIMNAEREKVSPTRDDYINSDVVVGFAEGLLTGSFRDQSLADLQVNLSPEERFAKALKLYGDFNFHDERYGHRENHNLQKGFSPAAFVPDLITPAALSFGGHGDYVLRNIRGHSLMLAAPDGAIPVVAALAAALILPEAEFGGVRRQQALALLAGIMPRLKLQGDDGTALAALLVAAAQENPELVGVKILPDQFVPLVRDSIWAQGFKSMQLTSTDRKLAALPPMTTPFWNLASMLVLAGTTDKPMDWFVRIRDCRRQNKLGPADAAEKAVVQQALQDWFARIQVSPGIQRAIQADCNLACDVPVADLAKAEKWDGFVSWIYSNTLSSLTNRATSVKELLDSASLGQIGANSFLAFSSSLLALPNQLLVESCEDLPDRSKRALTALYRLTDIDDAITFPEIPRTRWETLVTLGEGYAQAKVHAWLEPEVSARLARIRSERLGDEAGASNLLADPTRQPNDSDGAIKWQVWARLAGRAGLIVALQRHPEYFGDPSLLEGRLHLLSSFGDPGPAAREALRNLLGHCADVTDPATVLTIAGIRGPMLGDWVKLGAWLDDPRRRPKDKNDPLHDIYIAALIERDLAAGRFTGFYFGPPQNAEACTQFNDWLQDVLAATGDQRKKLIDDYFPAIIYCPDTDNPYPDLRMVGYDIERGGFASRALLLLSSEEFDPSQKILAGYVVVDGDDGKPERMGGPDLEPWLAAVAKLPRTATPEELLAEISAGVKARYAYLNAPPSATETVPREPDAPISAEDFRLMEYDRRMRWVADGCQEALVRLASRWSPARAPAQATLLALGDQVILDDEGKVKANPVCIAARIAWEQAKMKGLDDAAAFGAATAGVPREELKTLATLAEVKTRPHPLLLWNDEHFAREAIAAAGL